MKKLLPLLLLALLCLSAEAAKKPSWRKIKTPTGKWELVWDEEFDYVGLPDSTKWSYDTKGNAWQWGNKEDQFYTDHDADNAWVENGVLTITALKEKIGGREYSSARILSRGKGDWCYGRFEIRAKLPTGRGTWPAIWMMPTDSEYGSWPKSGEIDIMENVGYDPDYVLSTAHTEKFNHRIGTSRSGKYHLPTCYTEFHTYAVEWDENEWRGYVDDVLYYTFKNDHSGVEAWPYDKRFHMILNLAIGGGWGGQKGIDDSLFPHKYEIDYVRVYKSISK